MTVPPGVMEWVYSKDAARGTVMALDAKDLGKDRCLAAGVQIVPDSAAGN